MSAVVDRLDADSRAVLELALREAFSRGSNYIAPEDIERGLRRHRQRVAEAKERARGVGG